MKENIVKVMLFCATTKNTFKNSLHPPALLYTRPINPLDTPQPNRRATIAHLFGIFAYVISALFFAVHCLNKRRANGSRTRRSSTPTRLGHLAPETPPARSPYTLPHLLPSNQIFRPPKPPRNFALRSEPRADRCRIIFRRCCHGKHARRRAARPA